SAYPESPAPPMPTNQIRRPSNGGKRDQLLRDLGSGSGTGDGEHRLTHPLAARAVRQKLLDESRNGVELGLGHHDRPTRRFALSRVLRLMIRDRVGIR